MASLKIGSFGAYAPGATFEIGRLAVRQVCPRTRFTI